MGDTSGASAVRILAPNVLCVDDDPHVLTALRRTLCHYFCVDVAPTGAQGLELMGQKRYAVVIVDMKMPGMSGLEFLRRAREVAPETTRMLLTGNSDFESAVLATNDGAIFRFVCKPYNPVELPNTVADAVHHHHVVVAEKHVTDRALGGTVDLLLQVSSLLAPALAVRLTRVSEVAKSVSNALGIAASLPIEAAALVVALAVATEPRADLRGSRTKLLGRAHALAERLLATVPSSSRTLDLFAGASREALDSPTAPLMSPEIMALLVLLDWLVLVESGADEAGARALLEQLHRYPRELLEALKLAAANAEDEREVSVSELEPGVETRSDIVAKASGQVLLSKGGELTRPVLERIRHYARTVGVVEPIRVVKPSQGADRGSRAGVRQVVGGDIVAESDQFASGTWKTK